MFQDRLFRLYQTPKSLDELTQQVQDLRDTLNSAVQDLVLLKSVLEEKGLMDAALYKRLRIQRMLWDHSSAGASPWRNYSLYPYTLSEKDFLRETLGVGEAEVKTYEEDAENMGTRT